MVIINPPLGIYKHLSAFCFLQAGIFADLLIIRLCLASAYVFLIINCLTGSPLWPNLIHKDHLTVDMLVWGVCCFYVHMASVVRLLLDEQHVELDEHEEALWRMFYRVGGLSRKIFAHQIAQHMKVAVYEKGEKVDVESYFHITYKGCVEIKVYEENSVGELVNTRTAIDGSGCMFDFKKLGLLQPNTSPMAKHRLKCSTKSQCTFFQFSNEDIYRIVHSNLNQKSVWQTVFIGILARIAVQRLGDKQIDPKRSDPQHLDPLFLPLSESEKPNPVIAGSGEALKTPFKHIWYCMQRFFTPPWPFAAHMIGVRHSMLPAPIPNEGSIETLEQSIQASDDDEYRALLLQKGNNGAYRAIV
jgi:hypothetical protein